MELCDLTIHELKGLILKKVILPSAILASVAQRINQVEERLGAYLVLELGKAYEKAQVVEKKIKAGKNPSELEGIPVAIKDNMCVEGVETTCASKILAGFKPPYTATAVRKLLGQGALLTGRTNMDEFAMGSSTENSTVKKSKNPWDIEKVPGGSSGGAAVAVAAGETIAALGSDTGGSIRQTAAFCGVTGLKPTYGLVSRYGLVALASSLEQIGPIAKDAEDCAIMLNVISGFDAMDSTSVKVESDYDYTEDLERSLTSRKIGLPVEYFGAGIDEEVKETVMKAVALLKELGAEIVEFSLKLTEYALPAYYIISSAEASSNLARYDGIRYGKACAEFTDLPELYGRTRAEGFGSEVKRRIMLGTYVLSAGYYDAYYKKAQQVRTLIIKEFEEAFQQLDAIISPTSPTTAFKFGEKSTDPMQMYLSDVYTVSANIAGLPALSLPCGFVNGLPVGLQIIGKHFAEATILNIAHQYQKATEFHRIRPERIVKEGSA